MPVEADEAFDGRDEEPVRRSVASRVLLSVRRQQRCFRHETSPPKDEIFQAGSRLRFAARGLAAIIDGEEFDFDAVRVGQRGLLDHRGLRGDDIARIRAAGHAERPELRIRPSSPIQRRSITSNIIS